MSTKKIIRLFFCLKKQLFVTSNHQTNQFCSPHFFPGIFLSFRSWKSKQTFYWSTTVFFSQFWTNEKFVFFFNCSTEKKSWKKLGKTKLVVWCHKQLINNKTKRKYRWKILRSTNPETSKDQLFISNCFELPSDWLSQ